MKSSVVSPRSDDSGLQRSSKAISTSRLYFATRSPRTGAPAFNPSARTATARSVMKSSVVSPRSDDSGLQRSSKAISISRLYFATRSPRTGAPAFSPSARTATAMSAMKSSVVSPHSDDSGLQRSSKAISTSRLYFATRSPRTGAPAFNPSARTATARSVMKSSVVSPLR